MKKSLLFFSVMAMAAGVVSCSTNTADSTSNFSVGATNLITDLDKGESFVSTGQYKFDLNLTQGTAIVSSDQLIIDNNTLAFTTAATTFASDGYQVVVKDPIGYVTGNQTLQLEDASFVATPFFNYNTETAVPGYPTMPSYIRMIVAQYSLADMYRVRTIQTDAFYKGTTSTSYPSSEGMQSFQSKDMEYRIVLNTAKKTASLVIYNAKFSPSPNEPLKKAIILDDLVIEWGTDGYTISGEDIIPSVLEGGGTTPYPDFIFNTIEFRTTNDALTECKIDYKVAGVFQGSFVGNYLMDLSGYYE